MHFLVLVFVIIVNFGNHYSDFAQKEEKTEIDCTFSLVSSSNWASTSRFLPASAYQAYPFRPSLGRLEFPTPYCQGDGAVELSSDSMEMPFLSSIEQSGCHLLWSMRKALGRGFGRITPSCSASDSSGTRTFLHPVARGATMDFTDMGRWPRNFTIASKLSIADSKGSEAAQESRKEQREERQGQGKSQFQAPPLPEAPWSTPNTSSTAAASTAVPTQAEAQLRSIVAALKKNETNLPPELQNLLHENAKVQSQDMTKVLHSAVTKLGKAKKALQDARASRLNLHNVWRSYLDASVDKWHQFCKDFESQDSDLAQQVQNATEAVKVAQEGLEASKKEAKEVIEVESDGKSEMAVDVSDEETQEALDSKGQLLKEGMTFMLQNLESLKGKADMAVQESANKRPRIQADDPGGLRHSSQPDFAQPGQ